MKPGMKMLTAQYFSSRNEQPRRSEYGGNSERRMIGYDRDYQIAFLIKSRLKKKRSVNKSGLCAHFLKIA